MPAYQLFCRAMQKIGASSEFCAHALNSALFSVILNLVVRIRISFRGSAFHGNTDPYFMEIRIRISEICPRSCYRARPPQLWAKSTSILHLVRSFRPLAQQEFIECSTECRTDPLYTNLVVVMTNLSFSTALNDNSTALNDKSRK